MLQPHQKIRFEQLVLPHTDAALNLARWLLRNRDDAEDVVQDAMVRGYRFFDQFRGGDARAWLLQIVRNSCYTWLEKRRPAELTSEFNEEIHHKPGADPERLAIQASNKEMLGRALETLSPRAREVVILRELEGCSYKEIADITGMPMGTVMSSLSRARERLQAALGRSVAKEAASDL